MAVASYGTLLARSTDAVTFTTIAGVTELSGPSLSLNTIESTDMDSTGGYREFVGGLIDGGEVSVTINYDNHTTHRSLLQDLTTRAVRTFRITIPTTPATVWTFTALVSGFTPSTPVDDKSTASITLKLTGQPSALPTA
jgi:predicted secreted protein